MPRLLLALIALTANADTPDPRLAGYRVAPGFQVAIAATEPMVINPVTMTWAPDGRLFVIEWKEGRQPNDHIKALSDTDGDGVFDKAEMYMEGLDLPAGICFWDGWTYVTLDHDVVRFHDPDLDGKFDKKEVIATGFGNDNSHHRVSGLVIGPDGWLYMTTGDSDCRAKGSDGSTGTILRSGGVLRCKPDGSKLEVVAFGMRNPWGNVAFDDEFRIFHTDNDNEGAPGFTGCRLLHVVEGGDYGWRLREGARCCEPDYLRATWNGGRPGRLGWIAETGRGAPAGLCVLNSGAFPPSTRNLLIYPDVFRKLVRAYKLKPKGATFEVEKEFELLASDEGLFRPTDAEIGPDGALYILDWRTDSGGAGKLSGNGTTGRIYRMTWGGTAEEPARKTFVADRLVKLPKASDEELINDMRADDHGLQLAASQELLTRIDKDFQEYEKSKKVRGQSSPLLLSLNRKRGAFLTIAGIMSPGPEKGREDLPNGSRSLAWAAGDRLNSEIYTDLLIRGYESDKGSTVRRLALDLLRRSNSIPPERLTPLAGMLLETQPGENPEVLRAFAMAIVRVAGSRRSGVGEETDALRVRESIDKGLKEREDLARKYGLKKGEGPADLRRRDRQRADEFMKELRAINARNRIPISEDLIANILLELARNASADDAFLRDGITRGIDRLGQAGIDTLKKAIASPDPKREAVAVFALQGCRSPEAMNAILDLIDPPAKSASLPAGSDSEFFRTLREFGPAVPPARVVNFLKTHVETEPDACVWAIRVLAAMPAKAASEIEPVLPSLIRSKNGEIRMAALNLAAGSRSDAAKLALLELVKDPEHPSGERKLALTALRGYEDKSLAPTLEKLYGTSKDAAFSSELIRVLASMDFASAAHFAESALDSPDSTLRSEAIALLGQKPDTALIVANRYNAGKLPPQDLARVIEAVRNHSTPELQAAMQLILKNKLLAAPTGNEAKRLREFVAKNGKPERGKAIYLDAKKGNCVSCHRMEGSGGAVGPDLTRVWQTVSFDKRVESILEPSKEIKEGYNTVKVSTKDGRVSVGLLVSSNADAVVLRDAQAREIRIPAAEIEEKANDPVSLMPAGVVGHLSFAELADLLAFLGDQKAQESLKK